MSKREMAGWRGSCSGERGRFRLGQPWLVVCGVEGVRPRRGCVARVARVAAGDMTKMGWQARVRSSRIADTTDWIPRRRRSPEKGSNVV